MTNEGVVYQKNEEILYSRVRIQLWNKNNNNECAFDGEFLVES